MRIIKYKYLNININMKKTIHLGTVCKKCEKALIFYEVFMSSLHGTNCENEWSEENQKFAF